MGLFSRLVVSVGLAVLISGCATVPHPLPPSGGGDVPLASLTQKYGIHSQWDGMAQTVTMTYRDTKIQAMVGSPLVIVGNTRITLSAPVYRRKGAVMVPADFERTVIAPPETEGKTSLFLRRVGKIVVDAGHGGHDPGALGFSGQKEKDINLDVARRLKDKLEAAGVQVMMTRDTDKFVTLQDRTMVASRPDVDLFVSIHSNASKNPRLHGMDVYYIGTLKADEQGEAQRRFNEKKLCGLLNMRHDSEDLKKIVSHMLYCYKQDIAPDLAEKVAHGLARKTGEKFERSKTARYYVLRNTLVPAILIEIGFLSNPQEEKLLKDKDYRQKIADAIAKNVLEFIYASGI